MKNNTQIEDKVNKSSIINKIKAENNFKTDTELAVFFGISKNTLSNWRGRDTLDWELVLSKCEHMDFNWLIKEKSKNPENNESNLELEERKNSEEDSLTTILKRYEALVIENSLLKKENDQLKNKK